MWYELVTRWHLGDEITNKLLVITIPLRRADLQRWQEGFYWLRESKFEVITKHKQGIQTAGHEDMFLSMRKCCPATHRHMTPLTQERMPSFSSPPTLRTAWWYSINLIDYICTMGSQDWGQMCYSLKFAETSLGREISYYMMSVSKEMICNS